MENISDQNLTITSLTFLEQLEELLNKKDSPVRFLLLYKSSEQT